MARLSRSQFLSITAAAVAAPLAGRAYPVAAKTSAGKLSDIDHIVILMQENRSFDHYFGSLSGVRGFGDAQATLLSTGRPVFYQPSTLTTDGYVLPFRLDTKTTSAQMLRDLSHSWGALHDSWNAGRQDGFVSAHVRSDGASGPLTMGYYTRDDIPFHYALADAFTICDAYHASVMGPTNPNRYFSMTGSIDAAGENGGPATDNDGLRYSWETYPERLQRAGISWRIYRPEISAPYPVGLDVIMNFASFQDAPATSPFVRRCGATALGRIDARDMRAGQLPQVTWIVPPFEACEHPNMLPAAGEDYFRRILEALWSNPACWAKTAFIVVYDETDGLFDHVIPPTPPPGTPGEFVGDVPIGLGFRVPALVISPFSRGGFVCSDVFDHTSTLRLIETRFGVEVPNLTPWRRSTCGDLTSAFGFDAADASAPALPPTAGALRLIEQSVATLPAPVVPAVQTMPRPEAATFVRRHRPRSIKA